MSVFPQTAEAASEKPAAPKGQLSDRAIANLFLLPTIFLLVGMNVFPLFWSLYLSFNKYSANNPNKAAEWIGNANYRDVLADARFWNSFQVTAGFVILAVGLQLAVGFGLALLLNRSFKLKGIVTTLFLLPMMLSSAVVGLFWKYLLDTNYGLINHLLKVLHLLPGGQPINWVDKNHALWGVVIADTWMWSPFVMLIALAGLSSVSPTLYEAASVDRASHWFKFRFITLPTIAPLLMVAILFRTLDSFKMFDLAWIMTAGGTADASETVSIQVYREGLRDWDTGRACAMAYVVLLVIIGLTNLYLILLGRVKGESVGDARPLMPRLAEWWSESAAARHVQTAAPFLFGGLLLLWAASFGGWGYAVKVGLILGGIGLLCSLVFRLPDRAKTVGAYIALTIALVVYLFPVYWMIATAFKPYNLVNVSPPRFIFTPTFENFSALANGQDSSERAFPGQLMEASSSPSRQPFFPWDWEP
jgi:multiple sugar transport system permease protein